MPQSVPCAAPTNIAAITPRGDALYSCFIVRNSVTEKSGCLLTVINIGTSEIEISIETNINKVAVSGLDTFKNNCPNNKK